jgi:hypothetical protein
MSDNVVINISEQPEDIDISIFEPVTPGIGITVGGQGINAIWGSIFGTLSAQTDLWNSLLTLDAVLDYFKTSDIEIKNAYVLRDLNVGNNTNIQGNLNVNSNSYIKGNLTVDGTIFNNVTAIVLGTYFTVIGNGINNSFTISHNLNTKNISVVVRDLVTDTLVYPAIQTPTLSSALLSFSVIPQVSAYGVTVFGGVPSNSVPAYGADVPIKPRANTLYVTVSGNDFNEGTDPNYPLRTIKKACEITHNARVNSFNNPDVKFTIFVSTGDYYEENPVYVPSNTSIIGDNLRRCSIIPKNRQLDILWVDNSTYVWGVTFRQHLEPSAATAFADLENPLLTSIAFKNLQTPFIRKTLNYDQAKCYRDVGYLLSAVETDILNGNNNEAIINGQYYYNGVVSVLPADQITPTVRAIQQTKALAKTFTNIPNSSEVHFGIDLSFNTIIDILSGGLTNYTALSYTPASNTNTAIALLSANRENIQSGTLAFINTIYPTIYGWRKPFITTSPYIQGSSSITRGLNSNLQTAAAQKYNFETYPTAVNSILSTSALFQTVIDVISGSSSSFVSFSGPSPTDASTAETILTRALPFIQNETIDYIDYLYNSFQYNEEKCRRDVGYILSAVRADIVNGNNYEGIYNGLKYYDGVVSVLPIEQRIPTVQAFQHTKALTLSAITNQTTIETLANISSVFDTIINIISGGPSFALSATFTPGNDAEQAAFLIGVYTQDIKLKTTSYINSLYNILKYNRDLCKRDLGLIISGIQKDLLRGNNTESIRSGRAYYTGAIPSNILPSDQILPTAVALDRARQASIYALEGKALLPSALDSLSAVSNYFDTVIAIVSSGPTAYPAITAERPMDAVKAIQLIETAKPYIQEETVGYIDTLYSTLNYDRVKCKRDVGFILSAVQADLRNGNNKQTIKNGQFYYTGVTLATSVLPEDQITPTVDALTRVKQVTLYTLEGRGLDPSALDSLSAIDICFNTIVSIVSAGVNAYPLVSFDRALDAYKAVNIIEKAKPFIQQGTVTWVNSVYPSLSYSQEKCYRDVGFLLSAVQFDILSGNNFQSIFNAQNYYTGTGPMTSVLPDDQKSPTVAAIIQAQKLTQQALIGNFTSSNTLSSIYGPVFAPNVVNNINICANTINSIIAGGYDNFTVQTFASTADTFRAVELLQLYTPYIQSKTVEFVNKEYPYLNYDKNLCYRDVGFILSGIEIDLRNGNNLESIRSGRAYYTGVISPTGILPSNQITPTTRAITEAARLASYVVEGSYDDRADIDVTIDTINDILFNGPNTISLKTYPVKPGAMYAAQFLEQNKTFIQNETLGYINTVYPNLVYDKNLCYRDVGYILSAIQFDIQAGNNSQGIINGNAYYYGAGVDYLPSDQKVPTIMAFKYIGRLAKFISQNTPIVGIPAGGGMRVDGSDAEGYLRSFVLDSYTQFNEGGKGIHILNNGYAQLVSIFTICCTEGMLCESGGSCSINTSNCSFGLSGLVARGKSPTAVLSGTLANNPFRGNEVLVNNINGLDIYPNSGYYNQYAPRDTRKIV